MRALLSGGNALASDADGFEEALRDWSTENNDGKVRAGARGALFLKGRVAGDRLLTLAYDSERDRGRTYFRDIRPDDFYPTYGDGALREFDAQSAGRFYVRVDKERSYFLYGDFATPSAVGSENGTPSSMMSAPPATRACMISGVASANGSPVVT